MPKERRMITVRAGTMSDGTPLVVVFPLDLAPAPGAKHRRLTGEATVEVPEDHRFVIRSRRNGDLVVVKRDSAKGDAKPRKPATDKPARKPSEG